jgi:hypothetical protein
MNMRFIDTQVDVQKIDIHYVWIEADSYKDTVPDEEDPWLLMSLL